MHSILPLRAFKDNYIWIIKSPDSAHVIAVDPGDASPVIAYLYQNQLNLAGILITHHHDDHTAGVQQLLHVAGNIPVYAGHLSRITFVTHHFHENETIDCEGIKLRVLAIPGHTLDHVAYVGNNALFCGDTLFSAGCGKLFEGTADQMYHSLQKLKQLPDETKIYCGHEYTLSNLAFAAYIEPQNIFIQNQINEVKNKLERSGCSLPSVLSHEKLMNPFLRCHEDAIKLAAENYAKKRLNNEIEIFATLREWKNGFFRAS